MANSNFKMLNKVVTELGIQCQLERNEKNPDNCKTITIGTHVFKTTQWTKAEAEMRLAPFKNGCTNPVKVDEFLWENQPTPMADLVPLKQEKLLNVLESYKMLGRNTINLIDNTKMNHYKVWIDRVIAFHDNDIELATKIVYNAIKNKDVYIIDNYIYVHAELERLIKEWAKCNSIKVNDNNINDAISKWVKANEAIEV